MPSCPSCTTEVAEGTAYCPSCLAEIPTDDIVGDDEIEEELSESAVTGKPTGFYGIVQCPDHPSELPMGQCAHCQRYICEICMPDIRRRAKADVVCESCAAQQVAADAPRQISGVSRELAVTYIAYGALIGVGVTLSMFQSPSTALPFGPMTGIAFGAPLILTGMILFASRSPAVAWLGVAFELFFTVGLGVFVAGLMAGGTVPFGTWILTAVLVLTLLPPLFSAVRILRLMALRAELA